MVEAPLASSNEKIKHATALVCPHPGVILVGCSDGTVQSFAITSYFEDFLMERN